MAALGGGLFLMSEVPLKRARHTLKGRWGRRRGGEAEGRCFDLTILGYLAHKRTPTPLGPPEDPWYSYRRVLGGGRFL